MTTAQVPATTAALREELSHVPLTATCCGKAEIAAMLRFAGGLQIVDNTVVLEAEFDHLAPARRLQQLLTRIYRAESQLRRLTPRTGNQPRYTVLVNVGAAALARQTGLLDTRGRPVRGMHPRMVTLPVCDLEATWRGVILARGALTAPTRARALQVTCPGPEAALALAGYGRRLSLRSTIRQLGPTDRVEVPDDDAVDLITRLGAPQTAHAWVRARNAGRGGAETAGTRDSLTDANQRRAARGAVIARARLERALQILGEKEISPRLRATVELRLAHPDITLKQVGQLCDPPATKDTVAGQIRRLLALADRRAAALGITNTADALQ